MIRTTRRLVRLVVALALLVAGGCATVQPWDRDLLAEKKMSFNPMPMILAVDEHIYFSKEASMGGIDVAGGGCGCN
jgi:predicted small secreted protein